MLAHAIIHPAPSHSWLPGPETSHPVLESLVSDTHTAALLTAVIAGAVNGFKSPNTVRSQAGLEMYVPQEPAMARSLGRWASEARLSPNAVGAAISFFEDLEPARRQLNRYFNDANVIGPERAVALHRFALAGAWRGACQSAIAAINALNAETDDRLPELYRLNCGILSRLLQAAAAGETPCIAPNGEPFLPALPQRRRSSRRSVGQAALIIVNNQTFRGFVRDVSAGGFGLEQTPILEKGRQATIELSTGRRFTGTIVWYKRGRAGVRFARPLTPNDPLLSS